MHKVLVLGAGKIGETITALLSLSGRYQVTVCDTDPRPLKILAATWLCSTQTIDLKNKKKSLSLFQGKDAVISALPFFCNLDVASYAAQAGCHYFDLTEDVKTTKAIAEIAQRSDRVFMPQCGLAPGFVSIAASSLTSIFDTVGTLKLRVGALPLFPTNRLKYALTWSTDGLINEYANPCEALEDGEFVHTHPLEGYERLIIEGQEYEAFNTSGGLGSLCETYRGKIKNVNYKTIRYPGHRDLVAFLLEDLGFKDDRQTLKKVFERSIPTTIQDKCIVFVEATGTINTSPTQRSYSNIIYSAKVENQNFGAIQITTAAGVCVPVDLVLTGKLNGAKGFTNVERIPLESFLSNEFGRYYSSNL